LARSNSGRKFSYAQPSDAWFRKFTIYFVEFLLGKRFLTKLYFKIIGQPFTPNNLYELLLKELSISLEYDAKQLEKVPQKGPLIFVANHPFGMIDGIFLLYLVNKVRKDYFILINEVLAQEPEMREHFVPVSFENSAIGKEVNKNAKEEARRRLAKGEVLAIFPSGAIMSKKKGAKFAREHSWRKFSASLVADTKATVIPVFFHGTNSNLFHWVSRIHMNLRLGLLIYEAKNKQGKTFRATIGEPIKFDSLQYQDNIPKLTKELRNVTLQLNQQA
tara:strand:+ start:8401 stop:9225 length:825 start_codon:yes stop_codon:yes gene_type:complete